MQTFTDVLSDILGFPVGNVKIFIEQYSEAYPLAGMFCNGQLFATVEFDSFKALTGVESFGSICVVTSGGRVDSWEFSDKFSDSRIVRTVYHYTAQLLYGPETARLMESIGVSFRCTPS